MRKFKDNFPRLVVLSLKSFRKLCAFSPNNIHTNLIKTGQFIQCNKFCIYCSFQICNLCLLSASSKLLNSYFHYEFIFPHFYTTIRIDISHLFNTFINFIYFELAFIQFVAIHHSLYQNFVLHLLQRHNRTSVVSNKLFMSFIFTLSFV